MDTGRNSRRFGWSLGVLGLAALCTGQAASPLRESPQSETARAARAVFKRLRDMEGAWRGESTRGWKEDLTFKTIAGGSAVMETSFDAHPNETMVTLFHLNGDALELTHYCVAGNQPHLKASTFEDEGRKVTFTFLDGGNLPTRDKGHMDKAVFFFEDADRVTVRWTFYQDGRESWMEEIRLARKK